MRIAGVDCGGSKVAVSILEDGNLQPHVLKATGDRHGVLRDIGQFVELHLNACDVVYIEEPVVGRGVRASLQVAQTTGAVMSHLSVSSYFVNISSWKKTVVGAGNASKGLVGTTLLKLHPRYSSLCGRDQDLIDATCIALYGVEQQRVVAALRADH